METYQTSLADAFRDMDESEKNAYNWAVSDFDLPGLHQRFPNSTPKKIIRNIAKDVRDNGPQTLQQLEKEALAWDKGAEPLRRITAEETSFRLDKNFHGLQPTISANVLNRSGYDLSSLKWYAEIYINESREPAATQVLNEDFAHIGGLPTGRSIVREYRVGFVKGDDAWKTLEIQNARSVKIKLHVLPDEVRDFSNRSIIGKSPRERLNLVKTNVEHADRFSKI